jgi:hypothetical protein
MTSAPAHAMHELNKTGDTLTTWNPSNAAEVAGVKAKFDEIIRQGYMAYKADVTGQQTPGTTQLKEFDPEAERIIIVKPLMGG